MTTYALPWSEYVDLAYRTAKPMEHDAQLVHARLGMLTEIGELADLFKRVTIYGKPLDKANLMEEVGDLCWYIALECKTAGRFLVVPEDVMLEPLQGDTATLVISKMIAAMATDESTALRLELILRRLVLLCRTYEVDFNACLRLNIAKLAKRFGDKYSDQAALVRDLEAERALLEKAA